MTYRCQRCEYRTDDNDQAGAHMRETGHKRCIVCARSLRLDETLTCIRCVANTRADLADIEFAYLGLEHVIVVSGYRNATMPGGDALVYRGDGSLQSPQTPNMYTEPIVVAPTAHLERPPIAGHEEDIPWWKLDRATGIRHKETYIASTAHPEYVEERIPSDGREHVRDHWASDPTPVIAVLEAWERDWRLTFEHRAASDELATVVSCMGYLNKWLDRAAREHLAFDDFAIEIRQLKWRLTHVAGVADDPMEGVECFEIIDGVKCTGTIVRPYNDPRRTAEANVRRAARAVAKAIGRRRHEQAEREQTRTEAILAGDLVLPPPIPDLTLDEQRAIIQPRLEGDEGDGLDDNWECQRCGRVYEPKEYYLAVRAALEAQATMATEVAS